MNRSSLVFGLSVALAAPAWGQTAAPVLADVDRMAVPEAVHRATVSAGLPAATPLHLSISLAPADPEGLERYASEVSDPESRGYRRFLTPKQVGQRFGVSTARLGAIQAYLRGQGMKVVLAPENRLSLLVDATVAQAERAFDVRLARFHAIRERRTDREDFFSYLETPRLPASFVSSVVHIGGLENSTRPVPRSLTAAQARSVYKAATLFDGGFRGEGVNIAVSNFDGYRLSNLPLYYAKYALPTPAGGVGSNVTVVPVGAPSGPGDAQGEGDLDIQMVLGMAPLCNLTVYDGSDLVAVLTREVNDNVVDIISESYGWRLSASTAAAAHNLHLAMTAQGITYLAASGDDGTDMEPYSYPDYEPEVLQVGGTIATVNASGARVSEVGWSGSGGGYSTNSASFNVRPSWQKGTGVPTNLNKRLVPDLALNAAGTSGAYPFYYNGALNTGYVGTSFASPVLAGMLGLAIQKLDSVAYFGAGRKRFGRLQDTIYAQNGRRDVWTDITSGTNGKLPNGKTSQATAGWDTVTGWGAISIEGFVAALRASASNASAQTYAPASVAVFPGQGTGPSGTAASLTADDGKYYSVSASKVTGTGRVASTVAGFALPTTATAASVTIVARGPSGATAQFYAYNVSTGTYDLLLSGTYTGSDKTFGFAIPDLASYLSSNGTLTILERSVRSSTSSYTLKTDRFVVTAS